MHTTFTLALAIIGGALVSLAAMPAPERSPTSNQAVHPVVTVALAPPLH